MPKFRTKREDTPAQVAAGVEELISRLRDQGVAAGRSQADQLVPQANSENGSFAHLAPDRLHGIGHGSRISRTVAQENAVRLESVYGL